MLLRFFLLLTVFSSLLFSIQTVKVGVLAKRSSDITLEKWSATAEYLSDKIDGYEFVIVPLSFEEVKLSVIDKSIDFLLTNTAYYVELEYLYGISRIATLKNSSSNGIVVNNFGGVIFTKKSKGINHLKELKGKRFGAVDLDSFGGWIMAQKELKDSGVTVKDFSELKFYGSHDEVVLAMKNNEIDAGTVRTDTIERMADEKKINACDCKILSQKSYPNFPFKVSTQLYPEWPFAKLSSTSQDLANQVLINLLEMPSSSKAAINSHVAGWAIPLDYSKVHYLLEELNLSFYAKLKAFTFLQFYQKYKVWFLVLTFFLFLVLMTQIYVHKLNKSLRRSKAEVQKLNSGLELKVAERTSELQNMYTQERYLRDVLKTIADVNKLLVSSYSTHTIIQNSMDTLARHEDYKFVWIGLVKDNLLEVVSQSRDNEDILDQKHYKLNNHEENFAFISAKNAMELGTTVIEKLPTEYKFEIGGDDYKCLSCWVIVLPLKSSKGKKPLGTISVFSQKEDGFVPQEIKMLENLATDIGHALYAIEQRTMIEVMELEKIANYEETILAFVNIIEQRDSYTAGHTVRVAEYCKLIATEMKIDEQEIIKLERAAVLHDIGKVVTPDAILLKPSQLTPLEYELIKQHSLAGYQMLSKIDMYKDLAEIIKLHHVRYDGTGYPATPKDAPYLVPILSYIMVVADAFDAMTTNRVYKTKKSVSEAIEELKEFSSTQFHPDVVKAALHVLKDVPLIETTQLPSNELEDRRFAYFFRDSLTDVYNEDYLKIMLNKKEDESRSLNFIELDGFSHFNLENGWDIGNELLKQFAISISEKYEDALIFRYHGHNFVVLFEDERVIDEDEISTLEIFKTTSVEVNITHYTLAEEIPSL